MSATTPAPGLLGEIRSALRAGFVHLLAVLPGRTRAAPPTIKPAAAAAPPSAPVAPARRVAAPAARPAPAAPSAAYRKGYAEGAACSRARWAAIWSAAPSASAHLGAFVAVAADASVSVDEAARVLALLGPAPDRWRADREARNPRLGSTWTPPLPTGADRMDATIKRTRRPGP